MILLESSNRILSETISALITPPTQSHEDDKSVAITQREPTDVRLGDFDDVSYRVTIEPNQRNLLKISINLPCFQQIKNYGGLEVLKQYEGLVSEESENGYDVTLVIDLGELDKKNDSNYNSQLIQKIGLLKSNLISGVFLYYFQPLLIGLTSDPARTQPFSFNLRRDTTIHLIPKPDRVIVTFVLSLNEETDRAVAKVFMQEFVDARRRLGAAPPCTFTQTAPLELKEAGLSSQSGNLGFLTFAVLKSHLEAGRLNRVALTMQQFRNYLQYHIKCSKSYFHSRMRARVVNSLKILNRAKVEHPIELKAKEMKTIQGKTFTRQV